jgi:signal transduction histidine kinase/integral membrane sensor domain MASE1
MRRWSLSILVFSAYFISGKLGLQLALMQQNVTPVWPPSGLALAALLLSGSRLWPVILAASFLVNFTAGLPAGAALSIGCGNTLEAVFAYLVLKYVLNFRYSFNRTRDALSFILIGAILSSLLAALIGATTLLVFDVVRPPLFFAVASTWWLGDAVGILILTPLILVWAKGPITLPRGWRAVEMAFLALLLLAGSFHFMRNGFQTAYALFPVLIWAAFRFGPRGAVTAMAVVASIAVLYAVRVNVLAPGDLAVHLFDFQTFIGISAITVLLFGAAVAQGNELEADRIRLVRIQSAQAASQASQERMAFLSEASRTLASSLDMLTTFRNVVHLAVPALADICIIELVSLSNGVPRRVAAVDGDEALARRIEQYASATHLKSPIMGPLESREIFLVPEITADAMKELVSSSEHMPILSDIAPRSLMALPIIARDRSLGVMILVTTKSNRWFGEEDRILGEDLRYRITMAIENAMLYSESRRAVDLRDEFLSVAAHELKTPVTGIRGFSQLLLKQLNLGTLEQGMLRQGIETMDRQSKRLSKLIGQLLDISRIEAGRLALDRQEADVTELLKNAVEAAQAQAPGFTFVTRIADDLRAWMDSIRIEQVITNVLGNAVKYSPSDGKVEVSAAMREDGLHITVRDYGIGIPAEALPYVFDRFYQANAKSNLAGMGLGLYISREIIELHGGAISVETPAGGGSQFSIRIPVAEGKRFVDSHHPHFGEGI